MFAPWKPALPAGMALLAICPPGREHRLHDPPVHDLHVAADQIAAELLDQLPAAPISFIGCSFGALMAYEVARRMLTAGRPIAHLIAAAAGAPQLRRRTGRLHRLPDDEFLTKLQSLYQAVPAAVMEDPKLRRLLVPGLRAEFTMAETYVPGPPVDLRCGVLTLSGKTDHLLPRKSIYAWRSVGRCYRHRTFDDGHYFVKTKRPEVLQTLTGYLTRSSTSTT